MSQFAQTTAFQNVTLVDRAMQGDVEPIYDGVRVTFRPGEVEKTVPAFFARWLFRTQKFKVWTTDGQFVNRFAVRGAPKALIEELGSEVAEDSPIEIDTTVLEGWEAPRGKTHVTRMSNRPAELMERQHVPDAVSGVGR